MCNLSLGWKSTAITVCCCEVEIRLRYYDQCYRYTNQNYILILSEENVSRACKCKTCYHIANVRVMFLSFSLFFSCLLHWLLIQDTHLFVVELLVTLFSSLVLQCKYSPLFPWLSVLVYVWLLSLYVKGYFDSWVTVHFGFVNKKKLAVLSPVFRTHPLLQTNVTAEELWVVSLKLFLAFMCLIDVSSHNSSP